MNAAPRLRFDEHDAIVLDGIPLRFVRSVPSGHVFQRMDVADVEEMVSDERLAEAASRYEYQYLPRHHAPGKAEVRLHSGVERFSDIPRKELPRTLIRARWAKDFVDLLATQATTPPENPEERVSRSYKGADVAIALILAARKEARRKEREKFVEGVVRKPTVGTDPEVAEDGPCAKSLLGWVKIYEGSPEGDLTGFRDRKRFSGCPASVHPEVEGVLARHAVSYAAENRPTKKAVHLSARAEVDRLNAARSPEEALPLPSYKTMVARIRQLDAFSVFAARYGVDKALKRFKTVTQGLHCTRVGQVVILDEWCVPIQLLISAGLWEVLGPKERKRFEKRKRRLRPWLCVAIDVASRTILGMAIAMTSTTETVLEVLRMIISDKGAISDAAGSRTAWDQHVNPDLILTDAGSNFISAEVQAALAGLGIRSATAPAGRPMLRGHMERWFGIAHTGFVSRFTGRTFENTVVKGDYDPTERASLDEDDFCRAICLFVAAQYHNTPHLGLKGETPANAYRRLTAECRGRPLPDCNAIASVFGIELLRNVGGRGVRVLGLHFQSRELQAHWRAHGDGKLAVRVDPKNLGGVTVRLGEAWHWCRCVTPGMNGTSMEVWSQASAALRRRFAAQAALSEEIVLAAVREFDELSRRSIARVGLGDVRPTKERLLRIERDVGLGWTMPGDEVPLPEYADPFAAAIASTGPTSPALSAPSGGSDPEEASVATTPAPEREVTPPPGDDGALVTPVPVPATAPAGRRPGRPQRRRAAPADTAGYRVITRGD